MDFEQLEINELSELIESASAALRARQQAQRASVIAQINKLADSIGVSARIVGDVPSASAGVRTDRSKSDRGAHLRGVPIPPKYRDPESGATWSGRGVRPRWLAARIDEGRAIEEFLIAA